MSEGQNQMFPGLRILSRFYTITLQIKMKAFSVKSASLSSWKDHLFSHLVQRLGHKLPIKFSITQAF